MPSFNQNTTAAEVIKAYPDALAGKTCEPALSTGDFSILLSVLTILIVVLTGPSEKSLAAEAAYNFASAAQPPAKIILLGRSLKKIQPVIDKIKQVNSSIQVEFVNLDLSDNSSVRTAAKEVQSLVSKIDILINSAGIMALEDFTRSKDGFEMQLAACHIGHFLLTALLLPQLEKAAGGGGDARVVTLTSMGYVASPFRFDDWNFSEGKEYNGWVAYGQAKTANILFTRELARRARARGLGLTALVLHPGIVLGTAILQNTSMEALNAVLEMGKKKMEEAGEEVKEEQPKSMEQGCATMVLAAMQPDLKEHSGAFLKDCSVFPESEQKPWVKVPEVDKKLWELSEQWVGEKVL